MRCSGINIESEFQNVHKFAKYKCLVSFILRFLCSFCWCWFSSSICVLFQYRHRISKQFKIFSHSLNAATNTIFNLLQTNFNKAFCDYFVFSNFQIVYPFRFQQVEIFTQFAVLFFRFFRCRVYALFEIITWHFARCHQSFDTWFALFETFAHNDCQIILMFHINSRLSELQFEL